MGPISEPLLAWIPAGDGPGSVDLAPVVQLVQHEPYRHESRIRASNSRVPPYIRLAWSNEERHSQRSPSLRRQPRSKLIDPSS
jgi:hypothetical protein